MTGFLQDIRYAVRQFGRAPGFTATAVLTLALGIGANAAIFSLVDQILLKHLPVQDPDRLVMLKYEGSDTGSMSSYGGDPKQYFSYPIYRDLRDQTRRVFRDVDHVSGTSGSAMKEQPSLANSQLVSGNYFSFLGVKPALGQLFLCPRTASLFRASPFCSSDNRYWKEHFGLDPNVVKRAFSYNGDVFTIIGVAPPNFDSIVTGTVPDFFVPISMKATMTPGWDAFGRRRSRWLNIVARLASRE